MKKLTRPDSDEYFLKIASVVAERSTCRRHHVGAVAVRNKHILATGYNGAPSGSSRRTTSSLRSCAMSCAYFRGQDMKSAGASTPSRT